MTLVMLSEIPLIPEEMRWVFVATKAPLIAATLPLAYLLNRNITSPLLNALVGIDYVLYAIQGQVFRPLYFFSICLLPTAYAFLFPVPKRIFRTILVVGFVAYFAVLLWRWDQLVE